MAFLIVLFVLTFLIEYFIVWIFLRKQFKKEKLKLLGFVFLINLFTWPIANWAYYCWGYFWPVEFSVIFVESILIKLLMDVKIKKALLISFVVNIVTALLSFISFFF